MPSKPPKYIDNTSFSVPELELGIKKITNRINEIDELIEAGVRFDSAQVKKIQTKIIETIADIYGEQSRRKAEAPNLSFPFGEYVGGADSECQRDYDENLPKAKSFLEALVEYLQETLDDAGKSLTTDDLSVLLVPWSLLHPAIDKQCKKKFADGHYADAVETAFKALNERVKTHMKKQSGKEIDGVPLMQQVFSPNNPIIVLADQSTQSGRDEQLGYMNIYAGVMQGIRNPKAHGNLVIDAKRAIHLLFLASLLMQRLDDAGVKA